MRQSKAGYAAPEPLSIPPEWGHFFIALTYKRQITPEQSARLWQAGTLIGANPTPGLNDEIQGYINNGMGWTAIGRLIGMSADNVYQRYKWVSKREVTQ